MKDTLKKNGRQVKTKDEKVKDQKRGKRIFRIYKKEPRTTSKSGGRTKSTQIDRRWHLSYDLSTILRDIFSATPWIWRISSARKLKKIKCYVFLPILRLYGRWNQWHYIEATKINSMSPSFPHPPRTVMVPTPPHFTIFPSSRSFCAISSDYTPSSDRVIN
jgi:hypothetical protein